MSDRWCAERPTELEARALVQVDELSELMDRASDLRDQGFGRLVTYSKKVFIPLTKLCRDMCHYCTFTQPPLPRMKAYLTLDEVVDIARRGAEAGCREALFTLGDKPEHRYPQARAELGELGHTSTIDYLCVAAGSALHPVIPNIQAAWVKMGPRGIAECLRAAGVNDPGGTLMNESITRAAGASHGEELPPEQMEELSATVGRSPHQRSTAYGRPPADQVRRSFGAVGLQSTLRMAASNGPGRATETYW